MPNLGELRYDEVRRIPLLRTRVNSASPRSRPRPGREGDVILPEGIYRVVKLIGDGSGEPLRWRPGDMPYILASPLGASLLSGRRTNGLQEEGPGVLIFSRPSSCPYSPECVERGFCELRLLGILRSSQVRSSPKFAPRNSHMAYQRYVIWGMRCTQQHSYPASVRLHGAKGHYTLRAPHPQ